MSHTKHAIIDHPQCPVRVIITDCPPSEELLVENYLPVFTEMNVTHLIRLCEPTYDARALEEAGIQVVDALAFADGTAPPDGVVEQFRGLVAGLGPAATVAVHCVSGVGRAPLLAAVVLVDAGVDRADAAAFVRSRRRGAFNRRQLEWLLDARAGLKPPPPPPKPRRKPLLGLAFRASSQSLGADAESARPSVASSASVASSSSKKPAGFLGMFKKK
ncbi:protein-tyrosine phosphatase-like protein [Obelidium mucronatum]|nr:protein-tyrosine phosphatase-like protein [Obelidium mucronatum]